MPSLSAMISGFTAAEMFADNKVVDNRDLPDVADRWAGKADRYGAQATELVNLALTDSRERGGSVDLFSEAA